MKQILLIPILLISTLFFSSAQPISTFAPVGAEWWYQAHQYSSDIPFKESKAQQYSSVEELDYEGQLCRRIEAIEHYVDSTGVAHKTKLPDEYVYNNEDTVFYYSDRYKRFVPLYIFNVKKGDTLSFYVPEKLETYVGDTIFKLIVDSIYQMELNKISLQNIVLRQVKCSTDTYPPFGLNNLAFGKFASQPCLWGGEYTETLGCIQSGFIGLSKRNIRPSVGVHKDPQILCYSDSSLSVVFNYDESVPVNEECLYPGKLSIDNLSHLGKNLAVYPNPTRDFLQLKLPDGIANPHEIKVLDFTGRTVQTISSSGNNQFSVQNLPQGIYTVAFLVEGNWHYVKMMKL